MQTDLTRFYEKQISLTEWFEAIGHPDAAKLRIEDNHKHARLDILNQLIGLPYGKPTRFPGEDVATRTAAFNLKSISKSMAVTLCHPAHSQKTRHSQTAHARPCGQGRCNVV